jgi:hypothetical protein
MSAVIDHMGPLAYKKLAQLMRNIAVAQSKGDTAKISQVAGWGWGCCVQLAAAVAVTVAGACNLRRSQAPRPTAAQLGLLLLGLFKPARDM